MLNKAKNNLENMPQVISDEKSKVIVNDKTKEVIVQKIKKLQNVDVSSDVKQKGISTGFSLDVNYQPDKVISFSDLQDQAIEQFINDRTLLGCDNPVDELKQICTDIDTVIVQLNDKTNYTINDVYKTMLLQNQIAKALVYKGVLDQYKRGAVILGIDKQKNLLKSIDIVRQYSSYDNYNNDILPVVADNVKIYIQKSVPRFSNGDLAIVLGLRNGSANSIRIYPLDKNVSVPVADAYKVMKIEGLSVCTKGKIGKTSIWYGIGKIGISHNGKNLAPKGTKGIIFNYDENCYNLFDNTSNSLNVAYTRNSKFMITRKSYDGTKYSNIGLNKICKQEFGSNAVAVDYNNLKTSDISDLDKVFTHVGQHAFVYYKGKEIWSGKRHYHLTRWDHKKPSYYLAHRNLDAYKYTLGSRYTKLPVLCEYKK